VILAHHGLGEEVLLGTRAGGGPPAATGIVLFGRAKLDAMVRWLRRR
jgi:hypothetical protein